MTANFLISPEQTQVPGAKVLSFGSLARVALPVDNTQRIGENEEEAGVMKCSLGEDWYVSTSTSHGAGSKAKLGADAACRVAIQGLKDFQENDAIHDPVGLGSSVQQGYIRFSDVIVYGTFADGKRSNYIGCSDRGNLSNHVILELQSLASTTVNK